MCPSEEQGTGFTTHALRVLRQEHEAQTSRAARALVEAREAREIAEEIESAIRIIEDRMSPPITGGPGGLPLPRSFSEGA